jgi:hypothetical protein
LELFFIPIFWLRGFTEVKKMRRTRELIATLAIILVTPFLMATSSQAQIVAATGSQSPGSLFQTMAEKIVAVSSDPVDPVPLKCVKGANDGEVLNLTPDFPEDSIEWLGVALITCVVTNAQDNAPIANNSVKVTAFIGEQEVPVLTYPAIAPKGTRMQVSGNRSSYKVVMNGGANRYAAPPAYAWFPAGLAEVMVETTKQDYRDNRRPVETLLDQYYWAVTKNNDSPCITDFGGFTPLYSAQPFWVTGVADKAGSICGVPAVATSVTGFGINGDGSYVTPAYSGASSASIQFEKGIPVAMSVRLR